MHSLVLFTLTLSHITATSVGLDLACMTCIFKKLIDLCDHPFFLREKPWGRGWIKCNWVLINMF